MVIQIKHYRCGRIKPDDTYSGSIFTNFEAGHHIFDKCQHGLKVNRSDTACNELKHNSHHMFDKCQHGLKVNRSDTAYNKLKRNMA